MWKMISARGVATVINASGRELGLTTSMITPNTTKVKAGKINPTYLFFLVDKVS